MDIRFRNRLKAAIRRLTWAWKPYQIVKERVKVDKATYACLTCGKYCYTGKSETSLSDLITKYPTENIEMGSIYIDHIDPVDNPETDWEGWDVFMTRLFCPESNLNPMCKTCHDIKSKSENKRRRERRKGNGSNKTNTKT